MILVTGGTGFIGKVLIRHLVDNGYNVRTLIRPSSSSPELPQGVPVEVSVSSLGDRRGLRASMVGIDTIFHLAGAEWRGTQASLMEIDIQGTRSVIQAALDAGVQHIYYISHIGADRASAYPVLKAKAIAEEFLRRSGINYTIIRSSIVFGENDSFTTGLTRILSGIPGFLFKPGDGSVLLQPLWVEDLATCLTWSLEYKNLINRTIEVGGPEYLSFNEIIDLLMNATGINKRVIGLRAPYLRAITVFIESIFPNPPVSVYWLDYLAANRTCPLDVLPREFNLLPSRFSHKLNYLEDQKQRGSLWRKAFARSR
jgi:NADH dehydrogenase